MRFFNSQFAASAETAPPSSPILRPKPDWVTVTDEQVQKLQIVLQDNIWNARVPYFQHPDYLKAGLPLAVGPVAKENWTLVSGSSAYKRAQLVGLEYEKDFKGVTEKNLDKRLPEFIQPICRQMIAGEKYLYGMDSQWEFIVHISRLKPGDIQRSFSRSPQNPDAEEEFHRDLFGKAPLSLNNPGRTFVTANRFVTECEGLPRFRDGEIVHYIGENHRSPEIPKDLLEGKKPQRIMRAFVLGVARDPNLPMPN